MPNRKHGLLARSRAALVPALLAVLMTGCADAAVPASPTSIAGSTPSAEVTVSAGAATGGIPAALIAAAQAEGELTTIALPHDWCDYAATLAGFKAKYGLKVNELTPDAGSGDEITAIKDGKDKKIPLVPDVIDVALAFGPQAKTAGLIQPYKVAAWDTIPNNAKDFDGYWYGDYYGVMALEVNTAVVKNPPHEWADLLKPEYKGQVALAGDPQVSGQAINGIYAVAMAQGGSLDNAQPGLDFFAQLQKQGNFVPQIARQNTVVTGTTPIVLRWDYNALADRDALKGAPPIEVIVPRKGVLAGMYVQAISAYAPHPNAAKLWMEYLYSDEGQLTWLRGYCHPIRYNDLSKRNAIPADLADKLPPADIYAQAQFSTLDQYTKAQQLITKTWLTAVGVEVK